MSCSDKSMYYQLWGSGHAGNGPALSATPRRPPSQCRGATQAIGAWARLLRILADEPVDGLSTYEREVGTWLPPSDAVLPL